MKVLLSIIVVFIVAISPAQNLMASTDHGLMQSNTTQQGVTLFSPADKVDIHCNEHDGNQAECDSMQCVSALSVISQTAGKLVTYSKTPSFLLMYDLAFVKDNLFSLFRPPRA